MEFCFVAEEGVKRMAEGVIEVGHGERVEYKERRTVIPAAVVNIVVVLLVVVVEVYLHWNWEVNKNEWKEK